MEPPPKSQMWNNFEEKILEPTWALLAEEKGLSPEDVVTYLSREVDSSKFQPMRKQCFKQRH